MNNLEELIHQRNGFIKMLWLTFSEMSKIQGTKMSDEDLNLWTLVTNHSAVQNALKNQTKGERSNGRQYGV